jgi:hypothetical protein
MKEIDNIVKKVLLESLNEKADEITNKIHSKLSGEMEEDWGSEDDFFADEYEEDMPRRKKEHSKFLDALKRARKRKYGDDEEKSLSNVELDEADEFDYVQAEGECMEGDCGEMEEELYGNQKKIDVAPPKGKITAADFAKLRKENMNEKWEGDTEVEKTGEYSGMSVAELDKAIKALKSKTAKLQDEGKKVPKSMREKMSELYFAKRAKQGWKGKGSAKVDEEMEEGNAFLGARADAKARDEKNFKFDGKTYPVKESYKYSIQFDGEELVLTENELITMIEEIVVEEKKKTNLKSPGKSKGMVEFDRIHKKDEDINKKANQESFKKMKDYVKAGSKGNFETNPKHFPKGNGELAKMDKKAYVPSDAVDEYIDTFAYGGGMLDLDPDEIGYNEDWLEKTIEGSSMTGNSPEYANAVDTGYGKKLNKRRKENLYNQEKRQSYKRVKQPVDVAGENTKSGKLNKMFKNLGESEEKKEVLSEEMVRMKELLGYNKKTQ